MDAMYRCVQRIASHGDQIMVVAPDRQRSECGHSVTQHRPLKFRELKPNWYSVDGTPADCVRVAINHLAIDVDVVLSGVNQGANLGVDTAVSGTVAAAREATLHVRTAIAISHYRHPTIDWTWDHVPNWTESILNEIIRADHADQADHCDDAPNAIVWNINLPAIDVSKLPVDQIPPIVRCPLDLNPHQRTALVENDTIRFTANFQTRKRDRGTDVDLCFGGAITVTQLGYGS